MEKVLTATKSVTINSSPEKVWQALTNPALIKQYLFGTDTVTDWSVGSPIRFCGEWQGRKYEDKGTIKVNRPYRLLHYTYWSSMSGLEDRPENYADVKFIIQAQGDQTIVTVEQHGAKNEDSRKHSEENWAVVLNGLKCVVEEMS